MTLLSDIVTEIENEWASIEATIESDVEAIGNVLAPFLSQLLPSQFSILIQVLQDNVAALVTNPGAAFTQVLSDLESRELTWWKALEVEIQTNIINTVAGLVVSSKSGS